MAEYEQRQLAVLEHIRLSGPFTVRIHSDEVDLDELIIRGQPDGGLLARRRQAADLRQALSHLRMPVYRYGYANVLRSLDRKSMHISTVQYIRVRRRPQLGAGGRATCLDAPALEAILGRNQAEHPICPRSGVRKVGRRGEYAGRHP